MQIHLQRVGEVAELTASGSPEEVAELFQLVGLGAFPLPSSRKIQVSGSLREAERAEAVEKDDGA